MVSPATPVSPTEARTASLILLALELVSVIGLDLIIAQI
jgi:hypothetical protein